MIPTTLSHRVFLDRDPTSFRGGSGRRSFRPVLTKSSTEETQSSSRRRDVRRKTPRAGPSTKEKPPTPLVTVNITPRVPQKSNGPTTFDQSSGIDPNNTTTTPLRRTPEVSRRPAGETLTRTQ